MIGKAIAAVLVPLVGLLGIVVLVAAVIGALNPFNSNPGMPAPPEGSGGAPSAQALADIPANYLALYQDGARVCTGLHWSILAGIGKVESDHGRSNSPGVHSGQNSAGAKGPMQFLQSTFNAVVARHPRPANGGGVAPSPYDPSDAIHAAAYLLCDNGARNNRDIYSAIWNYNHDPNYVTRVLEIAHQYAATPKLPGEPRQEGAPLPQEQAVRSATGALIMPLQLTASFSLPVSHPAASQAADESKNPHVSIGRHGPTKPLKAASRGRTADTTPYRSAGRPSCARSEDTTAGLPKLDQPEPTGASFAEPARTAPVATYGDRS